MLLQNKLMKMEKKGTKKEVPITNGNDPSEKSYSAKLTVSKSTKELIVNSCKKEFLNHHPELEGMKITENLIVRQIAEFYLR